MKLRYLKNSAFAAALFAAAVSGYATRASVSAATASATANQAATTAAAPPAPATPPPRVAPPDFSAIVQQYGSAVVNVSITGTVKTGGQGMPFGQMDPDDPFFRFFRRFQPPQGEQQTRGLGSGFIVKSDGVILTNAHVVDHANDVKVKLTDGREFKAKVVGVDKPTDVAVLKIDAKDLPTVRMGDPSVAKVGEWVLAIGAPFGFENTATAGIISAKARSLPNEGYVPFLQTDVAVNPGNSGGPLFNAAGEVIGINSQIYSNSGGYMGVSFAIPIDVAMKVEGQLVAHGKVTRGRLGVGVQEVNQALAESFGLPKPEGALVGSVDKDGPSAKALEPGDVILKVNGHEVAHSSDLPPMISDLKPGTKAKLQIWRNHGTRDAEVTIGANDAQVASAGDAKGDHALGLAVRPLTPDEKRETGVDGGLVVEDVQGAAAKAGVQPGDVVLALNGTSVRSVDQLRSLLSKSGKRVALLVQRGEARIFVPVEVG
jgi:serine protease Do